MSPTGILATLKAYHIVKDVEQALPPISETSATAILIIYTFLYVAPFYISSTTRPSPMLSRDSPSVIQGRISAVTLTCIVCSVSTFVLLSSVEHGHPIRAIHKMGYFPPGFLEAVKSLALTCLLFLGPLFEGGIAEGAWRDWIRLRGAYTLLKSWVGYRNIVAGPVTEEILFRSASIPLFLLARASLPKIIFGTPVIFGIAHIHHFYEFRLTHPRTPLVGALLRTLLQFAYTTIFGAYATFLYIRTGSLLAVILVHAFCNWNGLPRIWGRVGPVEPPVGSDSEECKDRRGEGDTRTSSQATNVTLGISWTVTYYILLVAGAIGFWKQLWVLTESPSALYRS